MIGHGTLYATDLLAIALAARCNSSKIWIWEVNFSVTGETAPKSRVHPDRQIFLKGLALSFASSAFHSAPDAGRCLLAAAAIKAGIDGNAFSANQSLGIERYRQAGSARSRSLID